MGIELNSFPSQAGETGSSKYVDPRGTTDKIGFRLSEDGSTFVSWHVDSPDRTFMIKPFTDGSEVVGLEVRFDSSNIAYFALECESYDLDETMTPADAAAVSALSAIAF